MIKTATTTCTFSQPVVVNKSGDVITFVYPSATNQNFQYTAENCITNYDIASSTILDSNGFTYGEIVISFFIFCLLLIIIFGYGLPKLRKSVYN